MTPEHGRTPDPRDVDAEFARMLEDEGLTLGPGAAPQEPAAPESPSPEDDRDPFADDDLWSPSADSPPEPPSAESRARSRAAHPAAGPRGAPSPRDLDDEEVLYGDFEPPDPDLPQPSSATLWSWTALIGGFLLLVAASVTTALPSALGWVGALAAVGGVISLLLRVPGSRDGDDSGAEV